MSVFLLVRSLGESDCIEDQGFGNPARCEGFPQMQCINNVCVCAVGYVPEHSQCIQGNAKSMSLNI